MPLNPEQQAALAAVLEGDNLFITGPGGVGKSFLIDAIVKELTAHGRKVAVTALTGCAALLLGPAAKTIHSWAGVGLAKDPAPQIIAGIKKYGYKAMRRWLCTNTLIIDEVSMMTPDLFEKLDAVGQVIRKNTKVFGGLQVILVGDFFQLPPVVRGDEQQRFIFESPLWQTLKLKCIQLEKIQRQSDPIFQQILNEARRGDLSETSCNVLRSRQNLPWQSQKIRPTLLFLHRAEVEMINQKNLKVLPGNSKTYEAKTIFDATLVKGLTKDSPEVIKAAEKLDRNAPYLTKLDLKVGAQVMLIYNLDQEGGLVNGSRGVVEGFEDVTGSPLVLFKGRSMPIAIKEQTWEGEDVEGLKRSQIPLILAYAITIHKCQGATLDSALIDIGARTFEMGQAYVALSRVKSIDSLYVYDFEPYEFRPHKKVLHFYQTL